MGKPSYNIEGCKELTKEQFKEVHAHVDYFFYLTDKEWDIEYATATGGQFKYVENSTNDIQVEVEKKTVNVKKKTT